MTTLTSIVASVVVNSSAAALSHFGLNVEPLHIDKPTPPPSERVVARSHQPVAMLPETCPKLKLRNA